MDLRAELMKEILNEQRVTDLAEKYGVSRKTVYKFKERFERMGMEGLRDQSRAPKVIPHKTPPEVVELVIAERRKHPSWGPKKLKTVLEAQTVTGVPSASAIGNILAKNGLVAPRKRRQRHEATRSGLREAKGPNEVWCIDYKGQFRLGDGTYCYPLTLTDQYSRYILACEGMAAISDEGAREACEEAFRTHGLPEAVRSDNGVPFSSTGLGGLTKLSVFWLRLGIALERIRPGHPEENGQHERMHRTLKFETARPARANLLQQQERFDHFVPEFNEVRPHEALAMKPPASVYTPSLRPLPRTLPELRYTGYDDVLRVNRSGQIYIAGIGQVGLTTALAGEHVGIREERDGTWLVTFATLNLGYAGPGKTLRPVGASLPPEA